MVIERGSHGLEERKYHSCLQEWQEGRSRKKQVGLSYLDRQRSDRANDSGIVSRHMKNKSNGSSHQDCMDFPGKPDSLFQ